jgi:membrane associated rhomboid family serine protease
MRYTSHRTSYFSGYFPPGVKWLLIANIAVFVVNFFAIVLTESDPFRLFGLVPAQVVRFGFIWQLATYMFLHGGIGHIVFNMLALWMFGADLERDWGTRKFLEYYFLCGVGAGVCVIAASYIFSGVMGRTIGSSGAIYGLLLAFGMLYPDRVVLMSFLFPIKAKYFVIIMGAIAFLSSFQANTGVSDVAHLGGMLFGFLYLRAKLTRRRGPSKPSGGLREQYQAWQRQRARKKFQVYMRRHGSDRDRWVN